METLIFDLAAQGDLEVCDHHTIEDCGIVLGKAFKEALQDQKGIRRYGSFTIPMDETLCNVTLDLSSRSYLVYHCELKRERVGVLPGKWLKNFKSVCV